MNSFSILRFLKLRLSSFRESLTVARSKHMFPLTENSCCTLRRRTWWNRCTLVSSRDKVGDRVAGGSGPTAGDQLIVIAQRCLRLRRRSKQDARRRGGVIYSPVPGPGAA